ncbi:SpoIIE family protein phosphatase [Streptomyces albus]|uniref:SpoIIE family protein phosphatase n=1 Tax=Streptomyces albus TaxID=1888 RepID=UPI000565C810|nr:SpoIIE family protein phosphatase [Streptomyces albus]
MHHSQRSGEPDRPSAPPSPSSPAAEPGAVAEPGPSGPPSPPVPYGAGGPGAVADAGVSRLAATVERLRREVREAHAAADGRALVELAKGIFVERLRCSPAQAARELDRLAEQAGVGRLELAAEVINQAARDRVAEAAARFVSEAREPGRGPTPAVSLRSAESGALAASDTQAVAQSILQHALAPLDATGVAIWSAGPDASLTLAGAAGFTAEEARRWRYVPPGVATPARRALTELRAVWFDRLAESGLPSIGRHDTPDGGRVAVPAGTGGRIQAVLEICWPKPLPGPQPPQVRRQIEALAELCAHTLETHQAQSAHSAHAATGAPPAPAGAPDRHGAELVDLADGLRDAALVLRPHLDPEGLLTDFRVHHVNPVFVDIGGRPRSAVLGALVLEAYPLAAEGGGLFEKLEHVYATGEPFRTDHMRLTTVVDDVPISSAASVSISRHGENLLLIWRVQDEAARLASLLQHAQRLGRLGGFEEHAGAEGISWNSQMYALFGLPPMSGPVPLERLPEYAHPDDALAIGRFLRTVYHHRRPTSTAFRMQRPDGVTRHIRVVAEPVIDHRGHLVSVRGAFQDISAQHWTEVALAATRDRLAHTEQESAERSRLALQLQHAIMPPTRGPLDTEGLRVVVRYRPAETDSLVGGDWYDVAVLPSQQILLCVGDVAGHGISAATSMVVLRNALRGLAVTGAGPGQLLSWLNSVTYHLTSQVTATAICALYDPRDRSLRWARAGHLPPVLVRSTEAGPLPLPQGILLGAVAEARYEEHRTELEPDDRLLMYTDGLIERRDRSTENSLDQLISTAGSPAGDLETYLDRLLTHSHSDTDDDTCVIGIQLS